ncbi:bifunctional phosphoribosylaminoimidazolecarboxamide formyltransferase/IMP cyclohydrolase [Helicovermis profundi]|uniref:bifunctional phosphoribosylaminoimidazolecarboxamide formyltransferase/IMP cyclohydrolase n=1 Tax=Helicovermis profundi TaxID=3065157 RepID=UPI0030D0B922
MLKRALISVSDKKNVVKFASKLIELGYEVVSTGGTARLLFDSGVKVTQVDEITGFPECLDGRVKTLHPKVHGGILARRDLKSHMDQVDKLEIKLFDMVVVNLYPFKETYLNENATHEDKIENIDIGGPTMIRSAAKNYNDVLVVVDSSDYTSILEEFEKNNTTNVSDLSEKFKRNLALKAFEMTASYDALISRYFRESLNKKDEFNDKITLTFEKGEELRYGENPHQYGWLYKEISKNTNTLANAIQLNGKQLSFNNINDATGGINLIREFKEPAVVAVKHTNPCGASLGVNIYEAFEKAYKSDPKSIFGGIVVANREIDKDTAVELSKIFLEIVIAPSFEEKALEILKSKKNLRILKLDTLYKKESGYDIKKVDGGILIQNENDILIKDMKVVTDRIPNKTELKDLEFAMKVVKHTKSNAIVLAGEGATVSVGPGQTSRVWALENAIKQSNISTKGTVLASDAFFPFSDSVEAAAKAGITAIIQPGGSIKDNESIEMANKYGIAMVFTGIRHFKH